MTLITASRSRLFGYSFPSLPTSYSNTFAATESPISDGGKILGGATDAGSWSDMNSGSSRSSAISGSLTSFKDALALINPAAVSIPAAQKILIVARRVSYTPPGSHELEGITRGTIIGSGNFPLYEHLIAYDGTLALVLQNGTYNPSGNYSILTTDSIPGIADDDEFLCTSNGNTHSLAHEGVQQYSHSDATLTTGMPGWGNWVTDGGTPGNLCAKSVLAEAA